MSRVVFVGGKPGNFPSLDLTFPPICLSENLGGMEKGGKGEGGETTCLTSPPLASASNTTLSMSKNVVTLKSGLKVTQGHREWYHSIDCVWFPISVL